MWHITSVAALLHLVRAGRDKITLGDTKILMLAQDVN